MHGRAPSPKWHRAIPYALMLVGIVVSAIAYFAPGALVGGASTGAWGPLARGGEIVTVIGFVLALIFALFGRGARDA